MEIPRIRLLKKGQIIINLEDIEGFVTSVIHSKLREQRGYIKGSLERAEKAEIRSAAQKAAQIAVDAILSQEKILDQIVERIRKKQI